MTELVSLETSHTNKLSIAAIRGCDWMYRFLALSPTIDNDLQHFVKVMGLRSSTTQVPAAQIKKPTLVKVIGLRSMNQLP